MQRSLDPGARAFNENPKINPMQRSNVRAPCPPDADARMRVPPPCVAQNPQSAAAFGAILAIITRVEGGARQRPALP